jgi:hypothetical protein
VDGQCQPRSVCPIDQGFWEDATQTVAGVPACKKNPQIAIKTASDVLSIKLSKVRSKPSQNFSVEVRLTSGQVDAGYSVAWAAKTISSSGWLHLFAATQRGTVDSARPVAEIQVAVVSTDLRDTFTTNNNGTLQATIQVTSTMKGHAGVVDVNFQPNDANQTNVTTMRVDVDIVSTPYLQPEDVRVITSGAAQLSSGDTIVLGDSLRIDARALDCDRLEIFRPGLPLSLRLFSGSGSVERAMETLGVSQEGATLLKTGNMQHKNKDQQFNPPTNLYVGEVPRSWIESPGHYIVRIESSNEINETTSVEFRFEVTKSNTNLYIAAGIASVRMRLLPVRASVAREHAGTIGCVAGVVRRRLGWFC